MTTISVRLSAKDKHALDAIRKATGKSASDVVREALKLKMAALDSKERRRKKSAFEIWREIMAASENEPIGPPTDDASNVSARVREILEAKHRRSIGKT